MEHLLSDLIANNDLSSYGENKVELLNQSKRLPIILLIDTSNVMTSKETLISESIEKLYGTMLLDRAASNAVELSIITFNNRVNIIEKMREIKAHENKGKNLHIHCNGTSLMGFGLKVAIAQLESRKKIYTNQRPRTKYYMPVLFIISNGKILSDSFDELNKRDEEFYLFSRVYIHQQVSKNQLAVFAFPTDDNYNIKTVTELTGLDNNHHISICKNSEVISSVFRAIWGYTNHAHKLGDPTINDIF